MNTTDRDILRKKQEMLHRKRRVIFNNDGDDDGIDARGLAHPSDFLDVRTTPLFPSHVDTISYCTGLAFGTCRHRSRLFQTTSLMKKPSLVSSSMVKGDTVRAALLAEGTDALAVMAKYCKDKGLEMFGCMRMNDVHDAHLSKPESFNSNRFKTQNPACLMGTRDARPKYGAWSAVDYGSDIVREMVAPFIAETCRNYDLDGVELDFFRHPVFFRKTSNGEPVGDDEREKMTDLMRRISAAVAEEGRRRGRPFLIAVRTPDDVAYCNAIGLELERWMSEELIDLYIPSGYFRLNSWAYSIELGHKYGVLVYPSLSESRVGGRSRADVLRGSDECYRARSVNAWTAGADGLHIFNLFDPHRTVWREMGEPEVLKGLDKVYFASVEGVGEVPWGGTYPHQAFIKIPTLNPDAPLLLAPGKEESIKIYISEDLSYIPKARHPKIKLNIKLNPVHVDFSGVSVRINNKVEALKGQWIGAWIEHDIEPELICLGENMVHICYSGRDQHLKVADIMMIFDYSGLCFKDTACVAQWKG